MRASLLFTAPYAGTFDCRIRATTSDGANTNYQVTALSGPWPNGTWLELDNFTADPPQSWAAPFCDSKGTDDRCLFLGKPVWGSNPATAILYGDGPAWSAAPDAVTADLVGHMQITSCYYGTASCPPIQWGDSSLFGGPRHHSTYPNTLSRRGVEFEVFVTVSSATLTESSGSTKTSSCCVTPSTAC